VAADYREQIIFVHVDVDVEEHANILQFLGVPAADCPTYVLFELEKSAKYFPPNKGGLFLLIVLSVLSF
jgi:Thioredoxin-like domain